MQGVAVDTEAAMIEVGAIENATRMCSISSYLDYSSGGGGSRSGGFKDDSGRKGYEEYDAGDDEDKTGSAVDHRRSSSLSRANLGSVALPRKAGEPAPSRTASKPAATAPAKPANVMDLLGFDAEEEAASVPAPQTAPTASLDGASLPCCGSSDS